MMIQNLAVVLRLLTWGGALLVVVLPVLPWLGTPADLPAVPAASLPSAFNGTNAQRLLVIAMLLPPYVSVAWGLIQLSSFCVRLSRGEHFSRAAATALKHFGWSIIAAAALLPVTRIAAMAYVRPPDYWWEFLPVVLRVVPLLAMALGLIVGLIVIVFALVLKQATALAEENASFL